MAIGKRRGPGRPRKELKKIEPEILQGVPVPNLSDKSRVSLTPQITQLAARGRLTEIEALIEDGVEIDTPSPNGSSALVLAAKYGHLKVVNTLIRHGAKTYKEALLAAQLAGQMEVVQYLSTIFRS